MLLPWLAVTFGFRAVFGVLAGFCFLTAAAAWRWLYEPARPPASTAAANTAGDRSNDDRAVLTRWDVWRFALASGLLTVPQFAVLTFAAVYLTGTRGLGLAAASACLLIVQVGGAAARVWSGRWTDRHRNRRTYVRAVGVLTATAMTVAAVAEQAPVALVAAAIVTAGVLASAWHGVAYTEIASMAGKNRAGAALGLENTTVFAAAFLTPVMIPVVLHLAGWWAVWAAAAVTSLVAVPLAPRRERVIILPPAMS